MMAAKAWKEAFVAVSTMLAEPLDPSLAAAGWDETLAPDLPSTLRSAPREVRARALARIITRVVVALDGTWLS